MALTLPGIPFVYLTLPFAVLNDFDYYLETANPRELNRGRVYLEDLMKDLADEGTLSPQVFTAYKCLLRLRASQSAFHPDGDLIPVSTGNNAIISYLRVSVDDTQRVLVIQNVSPAKQELDIDLGENVPETTTTCRD